MAYIKDHMNVKIFLLVIVIAVCMAALLVVFYNNFRNVNQRYESKVQELNQTFEALQETQGELVDTLDDLQIKSVSEGELKDQYIDLRSENDRLSNETTELKKDLADKNTKIKILDLELIEAKEDLENENAKRKKAEARLDCYTSGGTNC